MKSAVRITPRLTVPESALEETFIHASGPGGQNVNKLSTAVQLRLDMALSGLPEGVLARLKTLAGRRLGKDGTLVLTARRHRTQEQNREDARTRLHALITAAIKTPPPRKATRPTQASVRRRKEQKARTSARKATRGRVAPEG